MCRRFKISGRVQGVFFRKSAQAAALDIGLRGWVQNLEDGRVETVACGERSQIDQYLAWLKEGPKFARVDQVAEITQMCEFHEGFDIL